MDELRRPPRPRPLPWPPVIDWWRDVPLGAQGVFALEIGALHRLFAGTGGAH